MTTLRDRIEATVKQYLSTTDEAYATSIPILTDRLEALFAEERARVRGIFHDLDGFKNPVACHDECKIHYHRGANDMRNYLMEKAALQPPTDTLL